MLAWSGVTKRRVTGWGVDTSQCHPESSPILPVLTGGVGRETSTTRILDLSNGERLKTDLMPSIIVYLIQLWTTLLRISTLPSSAPPTPRSCSKSGLQLSGVLLLFVFHPAQARLHHLTSRPNQTRIRW